MIYSPSSPLNMWDTWIFEHKDKFYLYTLNSSEGKRGNWDCIGLALSDDLVNWKEHGVVLKSRPNLDYMGTGHTWELDGKFMMNFSECVNGLQTIYFAESEDLMNWKRLGDEYACRPDPKWYQTEKESLLPDPRWDCIWVMPRENGDGYIGFLTATAAKGIKRGVAGCVISDDGLRFTPVPPVSPPELVETLEVDSVERIGDLFYMVYNGFYFLISENQEGPYILPDDDNKLYEPSPYTYFGRFFPYKDKILFNHHSIPRDKSDSISLGTLKEVYEKETGKIGLKYWSGNDLLRGQSIESGTSQCSVRSVKEFFTREQHTPFRMDYYEIGELCLSGLFVDVDIKLNSEEPDASVGMYFGDAMTGTAFLAHTDGRIEFGQMQAPSEKPPLSFEPDHEVPWVVREGITINMRVLVRGPFIELYMNDMFVQCYSMQKDLKGGFGILVEGGNAELKKVDIYQMNLNL
ncbi:hypothetical protein GF312_04700 [Candidatus Poribacteria bacterium]|nr:hypothetical protein [Candidatus Poribacteria bacterium]